MKYFLEKDGQKIEAQEERWAWGVIYKDETELKQFGDDGVYHQMKDIIWENVALFVVYKPKDMSKTISIVAQPNMQLFFFYRNTKPHYLQEFVCTYVFGWKNKENKETIYNFILPDDRIMQSNVNNIDLVSFNVGK